jgi:hypothetical protein
MRTKPQPDMSEMSLTRSPVSRKVMTSLHSMAVLVRA